MITDLFFAFLVAAAMVAFADWRRGLALAIAVGCLQDPVRKLTPGTPALFAIASLPVWLAVAAGALSHDRQLGARFGRAYPALVRVLRFFLVCLVPPTLLVFSYGLGAWRLALLGVFSYLAPIGALVLCFSFARDAADVRRLFAAYVVFTGTLLSGVALEYAGMAPEWPALGTQALGAVWLRYSAASDEALRLISGFYRSPDIMGWHAAMVVMLSSTLALTARRAGSRAWLIAAAWGALCLIVSGRRKAIVMPLVWLAVVVAASLRGRRAGALAAVALAIAAVVAGVVYASGELAVADDYYQYAASTAADAPERLSQGVVGSVLTTLRQSGLLGRGIGSATQGGQHLGPGIEQSWQESGSSKLMAELGLPGFASALVLAVVIGRAAYRVVRKAGHAQPGAGLAAALAGITLANGAAFLVSHQVYGDLTVMALSSTCLGLLLSAPRWNAAAGDVVPTPSPPPLARTAPSWRTRRG